jgi:uncharacterized membrane protein YdbT with pleckstrin-like domain
LTENRGAQLILLLSSFFGVAALVSVMEVATEITDVIPPVVLAGAAAFLLALLILLGWMYGAASYAVRFGGFTVRSEPGVYRVSHGVLTKVQYALRTERVEFASITATIWQRMANRATLRVGTAGTFGEHGALVPLALMVPMSRATELVERLLNRQRIEDLPWQRFPRYHLLITVLRAAIGLTVFGAIIVALGYLPQPVANMARLLPLMFVLSIIISTLDTLIAYPKAGYALTEGMVAVRTGFLKQETKLMPMGRVEVIGIGEPRWWLKRGYTGLHLHGMVHAVMVPMLPIGVAEDAATRLARSSRGYVAPLKHQPER